MQNIVLAANGADATAVDAITQHHSELSGALAVKTIHLLDSVTDRDEATTVTARTSLVAWCRSTLLPYLNREAAVLYPAVRDTEDSRRLVASLTEQLHMLTHTVEQIEAADDIELGAAAVSLRVLLGRHLAAETDELLPFLAFARDAALAELWSHVVGATSTGTPSTGTTSTGGRPVASVTGSAQGAPHDHECTCAAEDERALPVLDVREVPHAIRHATVFGALEAIAEGGGLILVAPHDPLPLLAQIEARNPGRFAVSYLLREPQECRLQLLRQN